MSLEADTPSAELHQQIQGETPSAVADAGTSQPESHINGVVVHDPDLDPGAAIGFDVIGVHGLHGQSWNSWKTSDSGPQASTWLSHDWGNVQCNSARVILYGYDSSEESGNCYTLRGVYKEAHALLDRLLKLRSPEILDARRPIIFISHDLGGLIVKAALSLAANNREKYSDILYSCRATVFIGYPHRPVSRGDLEEQLFRLLSLEKNNYQRGNMARLVKSLAETVTDVNHAFIHTKILAQAKMVNMYSTHEDVAKSVFDHFTTTLGIPQEYKVPSDKAHLDLTQCLENGSHPIKDLADEDWLEGEYTPSQANTLRRVADQAPLLCPSVNGKAEIDQWEVDVLLKARSNVILHVQCSSSAAVASEKLRSHLDEVKSNSQMMFHFRFDAHDVRRNNLQAALMSFISQIIFKCLETRRPAIQRILENLESTKAWSTQDLFTHWQYLRVYAEKLTREEYFRSFPRRTELVHVLECFDDCSDSLLWFLSELKTHFSRTEDSLKLVLITTKGSPRDLEIADALSSFPPDAMSCFEYSAPDAVALQVGLETSMLSQEDPRYAVEHLQNATRSLISNFSNDESLCRLLVEWLKSTRNPDESIPRLLEKSETRRPELIFESVLSEIPTEHRPWAQKLISWMLSAVRPLRTSEFCVISDLCLCSVEKTNSGTYHSNADTRHSLAHILQLLGGIVVVVQDEIKFCRSAIRPWLESSELNHQQTGSDGWYLQRTERDRHFDILQTCLTYLHGDNGQTVSGASKLPYAIEFWTRHLIQAGPLDDVLGTVFNHPPTLKRWIDAYSALPALYEEIPTGSRTPLPVAAHFGIDSLVTSLLETHGDDVEMRGLALVEAARKGKLSTLRLILDSYPDLNFDDDYLHSAVKVAASRGDVELFRELVDRIPKPPHIIPRRMSSEKSTKTEQAEQSNSSKETSRPKEGDDKVIQEGPKRQTSQYEPLTDEATILLERDDPFLWLVFPLCRASSLGMEDVVAKLLALGSDPNPPSALVFDQMTPLHLASRSCHAGVVRLLVNAGASLNAETTLGETPLHIAAAFGAQDIVKMFLDNGVAIDAKDKSGLTPLHAACERGHFLAAETILQRKKLQEYASPEAKTLPLVSAVRRGYYQKTVEALLRHGADPNVTVHGATALHEAVKGKSFNMLTLLVDYGADINKTDVGEWRCTPLAQAVCDEDYVATQYFISKKADVNIRDREGYSAVWLAARSGCAEIVRLLAAANADVDDVCGDEEWLTLHAAYDSPATTSALVDLGADTKKSTGGHGTALEYAIKLDQAETCKVLLDEPKDKPDLACVSMQKAVLEAVADGYTDPVSLMLEAGVDVNTVNEENRTLIGIALAGGDEKMVRTILEHRPDLDIRDVDENTALHHVSGETTAGSVRLVANAGCKLDGVGKSKTTPLTCAIMAGNGKVVEYLLTKKAVTATLSISLGQTGTPLHVACLQGTLEMVKLLLEHGSDINLGCTGPIGTPLIATSLRINHGDDAEKEDMFKYLLQKGADPTICAGFASYPIISASLGCKSGIVKALLDRKVSIHVQDVYGRKPAHVACYNSLEVLDLLQVPDADFAVRDAVGRVPLHYAVLSRQVDLLEEVLARSLRVGVDVNVKDNDGWTPLLWAARAADISRWGEGRAADHDGIVTFLLERGADPCISGRGLISDWTALEVAQYHNYDSIPGLAEANVSSQGPVSRRKRRGRQLHTWYCDCCEVGIWGVYFTCTGCDNYVLCFKCYKSKSIVHPAHEFTDSGYEWDEEEDAADKAESGPAGTVNRDAVLDEEEDPVYHFDDEIVGDDGSL